MTATPLQQKRRVWTLTSAGGVLLTGVILVLLNVLANWIFVRLDMTQQGVYSLSPSSKRLVRNLEDPVIIKAYFSPDLPPPANAYERYVRDLLTEYRAASKGRVRFEFALTNPPQKFEQAAMEANLMPLQFQQLGSDQLQIRRGFMGLVLNYRDKSETIPVVKNIEGLEYDITSRIARMAQKQKKVIAFTSGHGEQAWRMSQSKLAADLRELYDLQDLTLPAAADSPVKADAIVVAGPSQKFDDKSLWAIDQALMHGIPIAFLMDIKRLMVERFMVSPIDAGLTDLLKQYGVKLGTQLVYDAQCESVAMTQNMSGFNFTTNFPYPYIPLINRLDSNHPIMRGIEVVALPFTTLVESAGPIVGIRYKPLLFSSPKSWLAPPDVYSVSPTSVPRPARDEASGPFQLGGVFEGTFTSYFTGKKLPDPKWTLTGTSPATQIFVLGTSQLLNPALPEFHGGEAFLANLFAYLAKDETLLGIRSKGAILRPLRPLSPSTKEVLKYMTVITAAVLPILWGLIRWRRRQNWRQAIAAAFAPKMPAAAPPAPAAS